MSDEIRSVSSTGAEKGVKNARYDLIPVSPLRQVAEHFGFGARKYADRNWERGYEWSKSYAAMQRHANAFWGGQDLDEHDPSCETGCANHTGTAHLAAVIFHALAMLEWAATHPEFDDRPGSLARREAVRAELVRGIEAEYARPVDSTANVDAEGVEWPDPPTTVRSLTVHSPDGTSRTVAVPPVERWHE